MRISEKATQYIVIIAYTDSSWDCCNAVLVSISEKTLLRWKEISDKAVKLSIECKEFSHLVIDDGNCIFFNAEDDLLDSLYEHSDYLFVELEKDEEDKLSKPEQVVVSEQIKFYGDGEIQFIGWGKYTGEEFCSECIEIKELLENYIKE